MPEVGLSLQADVSAPVHAKQFCSHYRKPYKPPISFQKHLIKNCLIKMTTVVQVIVKTVTLGASLTENTDTTITLLTTISTTTTIPITSLLVTKLSFVTSSSELVSSQPVSKAASSSLTSKISLTSSTISSLILTSAQWSAIASPGSSTSGRNVGLAVGIPLAVILFFVLVALAWVFFRKKIRSRSTEYLTYDIEKSRAGGIAFERTDRPIKPSSGEATEEERPPKFLNRLSRMIQPEWVQTWNVKLPAILKSFNLKKESPPDPKSSFDQEVRPSYKAKKPPSLDLSKRSLNTVSSVTTLLVIKSYTGQMPGELSVVVGDLAVSNFTKGDQVHVSLTNREGYGFVPLSCLRRY